MVERAIAEGSEGAVGASAGKGAGGGSGKGKGRSGRGGVGGEEVFIKAAGKAIQRALELGVHFQKAGDCRVRIELGSVSAIDDIEIKKKKIVDAAEEKDEQRVENDESVNAGAGSPDVIDADKGKEDEVTGIAAKKQSRIGKEKGKGKAKVVNEDHIPETRIRLLSAVTVAISLL
jgi:ribonuclease P/MRP protein subunit POP7